MRLPQASLAALLLAAAALRAAPSQPTVADLPPAVVRTVPAAGETQVDPTLDTIRVTFSKDMLTDRMWSWCQLSPETFPECDQSRIHYLPDRRTCVLPVKLRPARTYAIWINTAGNRNFRDTGNRPAVPYLIVFQTGQAPDAENGAAKQAATDAALAWLRVVDRADYANSWDLAAPIVRKAVPKPQWQRSLEGARRPLGRQIERTVLSTRHATTLPGAPDGEYIVIRFRTRFANKAEAVETVTPMRLPDGSWRVSGYFIK